MTFPGVSTPLSSTTLTPASSVPNKQPALPYSFNASNIVELISSRSTTSSALFIYDLAEHAGFGLLAKEWSKSDQDVASVISLQTRIGAGLSLVGRLSQGTSRDALAGSILTAYTTPTGLAEMIPSLTHSPPPTINSRLILQIPTISAIDDRLALSPTLASLNPILSVLPESFVVLLSATPQESVDLAALAYRFPAHVIHFFDHHGSSREVGQLQLPSFPLKKEIGSTIQSVLQQSGYHSFDYAGDQNAHTVIVLLNGPLALALKATLVNTPNIGILTVRHIHIMEDAYIEASRGILQAGVLSSMLDFSGPTPNIHHEVVTPARLSELLNKPSSLVQFLANLLLIPSDIIPCDVTTAAKILFFSIPGTPLSSVSQRIEKTFSRSASVSARLLTEHDILSRPGGITADRIWLEPRKDLSLRAPLSVLLPISGDSGGVCNFLAILDPRLLKSHSLLKHAKWGASVLVVTSWSISELVSTLVVEDISLIRDRKLRLYIIDSTSIVSRVGSNEAEQNSLQELIIHLAFLRFLGGTSVGEAQMTTVVAQVWESLFEVDLSAVIVEADKQHEPRKNFEFNAIAFTAKDGETVLNGARIGSWHDAARHLLFPYAFVEQNTYSPTAEQHPQIPTLHPEIGDRTYLVTCTVNRRLTPKEYDRNVFHLEFSTVGTGLKYAIGEALGIHGWNDEAEVLDFCNWYGVDPARLITIPVPGDDTKVHTRTVFQALQQQIDLFGKPPKSYYSDLAEYATSPVDRHALQFIGSPEGVSTFKKFSEKDTVTFADVLHRYTSARPGIEVLCEMIGDIKPRHYSIASAQSVVGDQVDLLVVTVDWKTPDGTIRYGQCTRYLAGLKIGQKVTVSIKPSVMKLPAEPTQPLIMAGLGTGAAPFRAFLQDRALLVSQGVPIGPVYYYFGSRHQSQEYLYGEEIEAFIQDGIITKAGLAFSRDSLKKVYIQHKMLDDTEALVRMLHAEKGVFYLCGPTWPVPDVYETLVKAFEEHHGMDAKTADLFLEGLKEEERYVLEVY
ncbi:assimilatory sulfite reductase [Multifurca ochricompacta]|uniref:assimilatory sulfite reductase (NADPH) n=1 Tax=Multifurca ochricompacta TaxID=376703 RepID=A0AAD4MD92_9AGAM|nr:assimilatory sulfite reductase [Multifurca ochricompacta]